MIIFKHPADIHSYCSSKTAANTTIGFVPTMGALHSGHTSLVKRARNENQLVICSIFVNPTQFNDPRDFEKYPSTIENDILLLERSGCDVLFLPSVKDIYPEGIKAVHHYELGYLEQILEGEFRPGHFQGVCQVVHRLLDIVAPRKLYLGQKDYQQCMILKRMIMLTGIATSIVVCETLREPDGLAMSSRNLRLTAMERKTAPAIYQALREIEQQITPGDTGDLKRNAAAFLTQQGFKVDYVEIADASDLQVIQQWNGETALVVLAAAFLNEIRLIDNLVLSAS